MFFTKGCQNKQNKTNMRLKVNSVSSNEYKNRMIIQDHLDYKHLEAVPCLVISVNGAFVKRDLFKNRFLLGPIKCRVV